MMQDMTPEFDLLVRNGLTLGRQQEWDEALVKQKGLLGSVLDKHNVATPVRKKITELYDGHANFLFGKLGAGLKMKAASLELRHLSAKNPDVDINILAKEVAKLVNADFGGLHMERMERSKTTTHILGLLLLAKDWTESNILTMVRGFGYDYTKPKGERILEKRERQLYQRFWARVIFRAATASVLGNLLLAFFDGDDDDSYLETVFQRYEDAFQEPEKLNWLKWDITPIYKMMNDAANSETEEDVRKYYSVLGHFQDPYKWSVQAANRSWTTPIKHKGSWIMQTMFNLFTGTTWNSRRYTTVGEFLGLDDKGTYSSNLKNPDWVQGGTNEEKYLHMVLDPKGGKNKWQLTKWDYTEHGGVPTNAMPSFMLSTIRGMQPIPVQNVLGAFAGEISYFDAFTRGVGMHTSTTRIKNEDVSLDYDDMLRESKKLVHLANTYKKDKNTEENKKIVTSQEYKDAKKIKDYDKKTIQKLEDAYDKALETADSDIIDKAMKRIKEYKIKYINDERPAKTD